MESPINNSPEKTIAENQFLVIFGSTGDLTGRKLLPALFRLYINHLLPQHFVILGTGRKDLTNEAYHDHVKEVLNRFIPSMEEKETTLIPGFLDLIYYQHVNNKEQADFEGLKNRIYTLSKEKGISPNIIFYFSIPPFLYETVAANLIAYGLHEEKDGWRRIIVEKPFGYSYETAVELDRKLHAGFEEHQIYRIDHYLGKETVQNIMVTRFANGFFEPIWDRKFIDRIEITAAEKIGVENRGGYYETAGALRDMVQNHLLEVLAVIAMEPPVVFDSQSIRNETVKVLQALRPLSAEEVASNVIRGQYIETAAEGKILKGYREEKDVSPDSKTETFVALKVFIDNWRWSDIPFYIRTGKQLPEQVTEVVIHLKPAPHQLFKELCACQPTNMIILRIQPDAGIAIDFGMKVPGEGYKVQNVNMAFHYADLATKEIPDAYERLLLDCMFGDATLFARDDAVKASWKFVDKILNAWKEDPEIPLYFYECNAWGPVEVRQLFEDPSQDWKPPYINL
ncbi:MAG: glucose-6-phosphate dehydrogenase [Candidatus Azobacteroides sp.]|nr:glucose-6-phosphate dehydrogenase [Candidatus Azobacteroides sp.]